MVISERHKFLFLHLPKNAGTSITNALKGYGEVCNQPTQHLTLSQIQRQHDVKGYRIFGVVRNPWDRLYSFYNFMYRRGKLSTELSFEQFVDKIRYNDPLIHSWNTIRHRQVDYFKFDGISTSRIVYILKYEQLSTDWEELGEILGLELPKLRRLNRFSDGVKYQDIYTPRDAKFVENYYNEDVIEYGYKFI